MPTHTTPHKADVEDACDPGPAHRLRMCELAVEGIAGVSVSAIEIERGGLSYTVDTLTSLHESHPQAELTFIVGADTASTLGSWREPQRLLQLARLAVAARAPIEAQPRGRTHAGTVRQACTVREPVLDALAGVQLADGARGERRAAADRVSFLEMPAIEVSSSLVRRRVADGEAVEELVGPAVARYIAEHRLYRARAEALR